jgi:hypothetical protein
MITSLKLENFRGFIDLTIDPLKQVNLIAGANNTGKTAVLEALYLLFARGVDQLPGVFRSHIPGNPQDDFVTFWQSLFYDRQMDRAAKIIARTSSTETLVCEIHDTKDNQVSLSYQKVEGPEKRLHFQNEGPGISPFGYKFIVISTCLEQPAQDADLFNQVTLLEGGEERLLSLLREVDSRVQKLRYAKAPGTTQPLVYVYFGLKNAICLTQTGQVFSKLFSLFCKMLVSKAQVLLIDEIENGLYYESLTQIWKGIAALAAAENIQVFATTHSRECILAAHETFKAMPPYDFALHRLQIVKGQPEVVTHDQQMMEVAFQAGMEVR